MRHHKLPIPISLLVLVIAFWMTACQSTPPTPTAVSTTAPTTQSPTDIPTLAPTEPAPTAAPEEVTEPQPSAGLPLVDDFETTDLAAGQADFASIGYVTWSDGSPASVSTVVVNEGDPLALPEQTGPTTVLKLDTTIKAGGWGGFTHAFASATLDQWLTQDWSPYAGISFWLYGNNTGGTLFMDILDNRGEGSTGDDAERWTFPIPDDFSGWKFFEIPFDSFVRKDIGNGAPNDGFTFTAIHGYAIGGVGAVEMGTQSNYVDQVMLYGVAPERPVDISFVKTDYLMREGGTTTINLLLNKPAAAPVTVQFITLEGNAAPNLDFTLPETTITFAPGETAASFQIESVNDTLAEGLEKTVIVLTNPDGAVLNPQSRAILTIRDDEDLDPGMLADFNEFPPFLATDLTLTTLPLAPDADMAQPGQVDTENILEVTATGAGTVTRLFGDPQHWTNQNALSFWFYGTNSGQDITVELFDNRTTTTADVTPADWTLVWSDEFDDPAGTPPDPGVWKPEVGDGFLNGLTGWGNGELEYYTAENATTDGEGNLVISALAQDDPTLQCWYGPCQYTSSRLITWGRLEPTFGRIEARLKLPQGQGIWPAFWMLGTNLDEVGWPQGGEIDIMENIGKEPTITHGTIHGPGYSGGQGVGAPYDFDTNVYEDFHTFAIEWTTDQIRWYVDDVNFFSASPDEIPGGAEWVYNHSFFIILNLAVGGAWPGNPDDTTTFPQTMLVDYVRVYGAEDSSERFSATFTDNFTGWHEITLPFADFTRSAVQPPTAPDDGLNLEIWGY
ncbi:MAG: family 16 glycosylhydrolase, partial [Anaerolineales bacterium]|nr:family 16 glycosylhydrolase [Anaerolineales bacterium]